MPCSCVLHPCAEPDCRAWAPQIVKKHLWSICPPEPQTEEETQLEARHAAHAAEEKAR